MKKHIGRIVFSLALVGFVVYVEWGWLVAKGKALSQGISESEFVNNELATISGWEWPLVILFAAVPIAAIVWFIYLLRKKRNTRTEEADLRS